MPTSDEGALIARHRHGDAQAFETLYRRFLPRLQRYLKRLSVEPSVVEDLAQETLVRAFASLHTFDSKRPMWPWLATIARHLVGRHIRARAPELIGAEIEEAPGPQDELDRNLERQLIAQALSRIPQRQRIALGLRYLEDWEPVQAASFLGLELSAFHQLLFRARRRLRAEYERITRDLAGLIPFPLGWVRQGAGRLRARFSRLGGAYNQAVAPMSTLQLASAFLAASLVLGRTDAASGERTTRPEPVSSPVIGEATAPPGGALATDGRVEADRAPALRERQAPAEFAKDFTDPNRGVRQPEDAVLTSFAFSPGFHRDGVMYGSGIGRCRTPVCERVLFRSSDEGRTWERLEAIGFRGWSLLLPPNYQDGDRRIFAMGSVGLQVSSDGGRTFTESAPGASTGVGPAAMSPAFHRTDPTILIGGRTLLSYDDRLRAIGPAPSTAGPGPLEPALPAAYPADPRMFFGTVRFDVAARKLVATVLRCERSVCRGAPLDPVAGRPIIRFAADFTKTNTLYAFTQRGLFASRDGAKRFAEVPLPLEGLLSDLAVGPDGTLYAAGRPDPSGHAGGLFLSRDGGASWERIGDPLLAPGVRAVAVSGGTVIAALEQGGLACSRDGQTWRPRC